jgi:hypothetical protein
MVSRTARGPAQQPPDPLRLRHSKARETVARHSATSSTRMLGTNRSLRYSTHHHSAGPGPNECHTLAHKLAGPCLKRERIHCLKELSIAAAEHQLQVNHKNGDPAYETREQPAPSRPYPVGRRDGTPIRQCPITPPTRTPATPGRARPQVGPGFARRNEPGPCDPTRVRGSHRSIGEHVTSG